MSLSDIMGHVDLSVYPELALVIFVGVFIVVIGRALRASPAETAEMATLPIADNTDLSQGAFK